MSSDTSNSTSDTLINTVTESSLQHPEIKLVVTDLDGTLLNPEHTVSPRVEAAVKAVMAKGIPVVIATGKTRWSARHLIELFDLQTPGIYLQGMTLNDRYGTHMQRIDLDTQIARDVLDYAEQTGFARVCTLYCGEDLYCKAYVPEIDILENFGEPRPKAVGDLYPIIENNAVNKVHFYDSAEAIRTLRTGLEPILHNRAKIVNAAYEILEVVPLNTSKGAMLKVLLPQLGIDPINMLAIGDGENDLEMLEMAGLGIAMGNAMPRLKQVAKAIVGSNADDGVAEALERYVL